MLTAWLSTPNHCMDVTPEGVFRRLVQEHKGSYCFGQNTLLLGMLRGLGFRAYSGAGRVNTSPPKSGIVDYTAIAHMVLFVQPIADSNETYLVDVGFGGTNLAQPILLSNAETNVVRGTVLPDRHRLTRGAHPSSCLESFKSSNVTPSVDWQLEFTRDFVNPTWSILYAFSEKEFFLPDYAAASFTVSTRPWETIFWSDIVVIKYFLLSEQERDAVENTCNAKGFGEAVGTDTKIDRSRGTWMGQYILANGRVKRRVGTQSETIAELKDEIERIRAVREIFGIDVGDNGAKYIEGRAAALPPNMEE